MGDLLQAELEKAQQCLLETYELAVAYGDNEDKHPEKYLQLMEEICQIRDDARGNGYALEVAMEERTTADFDKIYKRELAKSHGKNCQAKKTSEYKAFNKRLTEIANAAEGAAGSSDGGAASAGSSNNAKADGGLIEMDMQVNLDDPLTKRRMVDPVKNNLCGHVYELSSIRDAIQINPRLRCPVAGCGNKQFVSMSHLKPDNALKLHLQRLADAEEDE